MISLMGVDGDHTFHHLIRQSSQQGVDCQVVNLRAIAERGRWVLPLTPHSAEARVEVDEKIYRLSPDDSFFFRALDLQRVYEEPARQQRWTHLMSGLCAWLAGVEGRVINRPGHATDNALKAWHEVLIAQRGFRVPESITTSKKEELLDFLGAGRAIAKSLSGVRSDAREIVRLDLERYAPNQGPVHLQRLVEGLDVRVHVVHNESFAVAIKSASVDYRTSLGENGYHSFRLAKKLHNSLIEATCEQGLELAGWDFKVDRSGAFWCLECNPMPGFSNYDIRGNLAISRAVLRRLSIDSQTSKKKG